MPTQTIVLAEDDGAIRELLTHHLEREGFAVVGVADGNSALRLARGAADLLVLDVGLPGVDGYDVARTLRREDRTVPIVMVTGRCDELDRVVGFELGADDYLCKPFSPRELVVRVKAILRRAGRPVVPAGPLLRFGRLEIDPAAREARVDGTDVKLKPREFALLDGVRGQCRRRAFARLAAAARLGLRLQRRRANGRRSRPPVTHEN